MNITNNLIKYLVTLSLIVGYYDEPEFTDPIIKNVEFEVEALSEAEAIEIAKRLDDSDASVYTSMAYEM